MHFKLMMEVTGSLKLATHPDFKFPPEHRYYNVTKTELKPWTLMAPFVIDKSRNKLVVDISNAFPVDIDNKPLDLGELFFGILQEDDSVIIFGDQVPYRNWELTRKYDGVIEQRLDSNYDWYVTTGKITVSKATPN